MTGKICFTLTVIVTLNGPIFKPIWGNMAKIFSNIHQYMGNFGWYMAILGLFVVFPSRLHVEPGLIQAVLGQWSDKPNQVKPCQVHIVTIRLKERYNGITLTLRVLSHRSNPHTSRDLVSPDLGFFKRNFRFILKLSEKRVAAMGAWLLCIINSTIKGMEQKLQLKTCSV